MTIDAERPTPRYAVIAWWRSKQNQDVGAIERMTLDDYLCAGGPGVRTAGRDELLEGASRLLASAVIEDWSVTGLEVREHGDVAA